MSSLAEAVPADVIAERARQVRFGSVLATVIAAVFFALGWVLGWAWTGIVYCVIAARVGYWRGTGLTEEQVYARLRPEPPEPPAAGP